MEPGRLIEAGSGVGIDVPTGWVVVEELGAVGCRAATAAQADVTGRHLAPEIRLAPVRRVDSWSMPSEPSPAAERLHRAAVGIVDGARRTDPEARLIEAGLWGVPGPDGTGTGVRLDLLTRDMTTPMVLAVILVPTPDGLVEVTAAIPVAQYREVVDVVEASLATLRCPRPVLVDPAALPLGELWAERAFRPSPAWLTRDELEIFTRGSHKIAPSARPGAARAGLIGPRGTATPLGHYLRQARYRPDVRGTFQVLLPGGPGASVVAELVVERLGTHALVTASPPVGAGRDGWGSPVRTVEAIDVAEAPARILGWLGTGPGRTHAVPDGLELVWTIERAPTAAGAAASRQVHTPASIGPLGMWRAVLTALG